MTFGLAREEIRLISGTIDFVRGSMAHSYPMGFELTNVSPKPIIFHEVSRLFRWHDTHSA